jgi:SnoaL-like domain
MSLKVEDKLEISELLSRYNLSMDRNDVEGWLNTWLDDGAFIANFGEARGRKELEELMKRILSEFASGKRHVTTNLIIGREEKNGVGVISYLTVIDAKRKPSIVASGLYKDILQKDDKNNWKFLHRRLEVDLVDNES